MKLTPSEQELNLLAAIPFRLGYRPKNSVVLVSIREDSQVGLMMRTDLDDVDEAGEAIVIELAEHLYRDGAVAVVGAVYSDDDVAAASNGEEICLKTAKVLSHLIDGCRRPDLVRMWLVGEHEFTEVDFMGPWPTVTAMYGIDALSTTPIAAQMVLSGQRVVEDRSDLGRLPNVPDGTEVVTHIEARSAGEGCEASLSGVLALWREVVDRGPMAWPAPDQLEAEGQMWRLLAEAIHDVETRDAMIIEVALESEKCADQECTCTSTEAAGAAMAAMLDPTLASVPDLDRVQRAVVALEVMATFTAPELRAPTCTLLALMAWWSGHGTLASVRLDQALEVDPDYRLANLVDSTLLNGIAPAWLAAAGALQRTGNTL